MQYAGAFQVVYLCILYKYSMPISVYMTMPILKPITFCAQWRLDM